MYQNPLINNIHARMIFYEGAWRIENIDPRIGTFVNDKPILDEVKVLSNALAFNSIITSTNIISPNNDYTKKVR